MKKYLFAGIAFLMNATTNARHISMPSLQRLHDKVSTVLEQGKTMSFKEMLESQNIQGMVVQGTNIVLGGDACAAENQFKLKDIEKKLNDLHWAKQVEFVAAVEAKKRVSDNDAAVLLRDKMKERYGSAKGLLMLFAKDVACEELQLKETLNDLLKVPKNEHDAAGHVRTLIERQNTYASVLQRLIGVSNLLLM